MDQHAVRRRDRRGHRRSTHAATAAGGADHRRCRRRARLRPRARRAAPGCETGQHPARAIRRRAGGASVPHRLRDRPAARRLDAPHSAGHVHRHPCLRLARADDRRRARPPFRPVLAGVHAVLAVHRCGALRLARSQRDHPRHPVRTPAPTRPAPHRSATRHGRGPRRRHGQAPLGPLRVLHGVRQGGPPSPHLVRTADPARVLRRAGAAPCVAHPRLCPTGTWCSATQLAASGTDQTAGRSALRRPPACRPAARASAASGSAPFGSTAGTATGASAAAWSTSRAAACGPAVAEGGTATSGAVVSAAGGPGVPGAGGSGTAGWGSAARGATAVPAEGRHFAD